MRSSRSSDNAVRHELGYILNPDDWADAAGDLRAAADNDGLAVSCCTDSGRQFYAVAGIQQPYQTEDTKENARIAPFLCYRTECKALLWGQAL